MNAEQVRDPAPERLRITIVVEDTGRSRILIEGMQKTNWIAVRNVLEDMHDFAKERSRGNTGEKIVHAKEMPPDEIRRLTESNNEPNVH